MGPGPQNFEDTPKSRGHVQTLCPSQPPPPCCPEQANRVRSDIRVCVCVGWGERCPSWEALQGKGSKHVFELRGGRGGKKWGL